MIKLKAARDALEAVCREHNVKILGKRESDGFTADIIIFKPPEEPNSLKAKGGYLILGGLNHETR